MNYIAKITLVLFTLLCLGCDKKDDSIPTERVLDVYTASFDLQPQNTSSIWRHCSFSEDENHSNFSIRLTDINDDGYRSNVIIIKVPYLSDTCYSVVSKKEFDSNSSQNLSFSVFYETDHDAIIDYFDIVPSAEATNTLCLTQINEDEIIGNFSLSFAYDTLRGPSQHPVSNLPSAFSLLNGTFSAGRR